MRPQLVVQHPAYTSGHVPLRPSWRCGLCRNFHWPCWSIRRLLLVHLPRAALLEYMGPLLVDAARDLPAVPADVLYCRFLAWTWGPRPIRPRPTPGPNRRR